MNLVVYGIDYKIADIKLRETYYLNTANTISLLSKLNKNGIRPAVIISTCNRTEFYLESKNDFLFRDNFRRTSGVDALRHLMRLACGLESQILGETEILSQIKHAYHLSLKNGMTNAYFNKIFQNAIRVGKLVRSVTDISKGNISFGSIVFSKAKEFFIDLDGVHVFIIGTGEMAKKTLRYFYEAKSKVQIVSGKNYEKGLLLASKFNISVIKFNTFKSIISSADIIITATSSPHILIEKCDLADVKKPLLIFDLSVPRNVNNNVTENNFVHLYDIDDLKKISDNSINIRINAIPKVESIIENEINKLLSKD